MPPKRVAPIRVEGNVTSNLPPAQRFGFSASGHRNVQNMVKKYEEIYNNALKGKTTKRPLKRKKNALLIIVKAAQILRKENPGINWCDLIQAASKGYRKSHGLPDKEYKPCRVRGPSKKKKKKNYKKDDEETEPE